MARLSKKTKIETVANSKKNLFPHSQFPIRLEFNEEKSEEKHVLYFQNIAQMEKYKDQRLKKARNLKVYQKDDNTK